MNAKQQYKAAWSGLRDEMNRAPEWQTWNDYNAAYGELANVVFVC